MNKEKILVIGGCGYIGSKLYNFLVEKDFDVSSVDLEWFGNPARIPNNKIDYRELSSWFIGQFDTIILLAGHCNPKMCEGSPLSSFKNNVENFVNLCGKLCSTQKFIYASSIGVYGKAKIVDEESILGAPINYYDLSKSIIDNYAKLSNLIYFGLRFGAVNGISPNFRRDVLVNGMTISAIENNKISVSNPLSIRGVLGINDLCEGINKIIQFGSNKNRGIYNFTSFNGYIGDIATEIAEYFKVKKELLEPTIDCYDSLIDNCKFKKEFNFIPTDSLISIVREIDENYGKFKIGTRDKKFYD